MKIAVIGSGTWGTAFARLMANDGNEVLLVCRGAEQADAINAYHRNPRYLFDIALPEGLSAADTASADLSDAGVVAIAVPSQAFSAVIDGIGERMGPDAVLLSMTKGLDPSSGKRLSELAVAQLGDRRVAVLSGPNHAEEVAHDFPMASVVAAADIELARELQAAISSRLVRVYASRDVVGVELCGASKNVIGLTAGISDGLGFGDNAKAAIITRGMAEMYRLGTAFGADARTYAGMAGMGDLVATCTSRHSRNRRAGELLAQGVPAGWIESEIGQVAEGLTTAPVLRQIARARGLELPITNAVCEIAFERKEPLQALTELMARADPVEE
jgi:glycerol-3-phosphate dehydrogenase (NAD(P)+)